MYSLQIVNRDWTIYEIISDFDWDSVEVNEINSFTLFKYDENLFWKKIELYDWDKLLYSWLIKNIKIQEQKKLYRVVVYPLTFDLKSDFYEDGLWNKIVYKNDKLSNVLTDIITQYRNNTANPLLNTWDIEDLDINVDYTFKFDSLFDAFNKLKKYITSDNYLKVNNDWTIDLKDNTLENQLTFKKDISSIDVEIREDEIINFVYFDNLATWDDAIKKEYQDSTSISNYWKGVDYLKDSSITTETWADELVAAYLAKNKDPKITVDRIWSNKDVDLYGKLIIKNWDKKISDNLFVVSKKYNNKNKSWNYVDIILWNKWDSREPISQTKETIETVSNRDIKNVPSYITETKITSTTVESPTIAWNNGLFSETFKVGTSWIEINGWATTPYIQSSNYSSWSTWWKIENSWDAEFNNVTVRGTISTSTITATTKIWISWIEINGWASTPYIQSSNYSAGSTWWKIDNSGFAEFQNITARGDIEATAATFNYADSDNVAWNAKDTDNVSWTSASTVESNASNWAAAKTVTDATFNSNNRYKKWLNASEMESWSNPSTWVIMDSWWIRGYSSSTKKFEINNSTWDAFFKWQIWASQVNSSSIELINSTTDKIELNADTAPDIWPQITLLTEWSTISGATSAIVLSSWWGLISNEAYIWFYNGWTKAGVWKWTLDKKITINWNDYFSDVIETDKSIYSEVDLMANDDLLVKDDAYIWGKTYLEWKLKIPVWTDLY